MSILRNQNSVFGPESYFRHAISWVVVVSRKTKYHLHFPSLETLLSKLHWESSEKN